MEMHVQKGELSERSKRALRRSNPTPPAAEQPSKKKARKHIERTPQSGPQRRRSSFVRGRVQKSLKRQSSTELSKEIGNDLKPEEKLTRLTQSCLEYSIQMLEDEMPELEALQQFKIEVIDAVSNSFTKLRSLKNDEPMKSIAILTSESEAWDNILQLRHQLADSSNLAERLQARSNGSLGNKSHTKLLDAAPDLNSMLSNLNQLKQSFVLKVDEIAKTIEFLLQFVDSVEAHTTQQIKEFGYNAFGTMTDEIGSKKTIQDIINN